MKRAVPFAAGRKYGVGFAVAGNGAHRWRKQNALEVHSDPLWLDEIQASHWRGREARPDFCDGIAGLSVKSTVNIPGNSPSSMRTVPRRFEPGPPWNTRSWPKSTSASMGLRSKA
jgi:hypothetical protein